MILDMCFCLELSLACWNLQNDEWVIVNFIEPARAGHFAPTQFLTLFVV